MERGFLLTIEGIDGAGKTTHIPFIKSLIEKEFNKEVITTREPGGTELAEQIRGMILMDREVPITPITELALFNAARVDHLSNKIIPALEAGQIVLCDRFIDSSWVYQGYAKGLKPQATFYESIILDYFTFSFYTLFFNIPFELSIQRLNNRSDLNHFDKEGLDFKQKIYEGYMERKHSKGNRMFEVDASGSISQVEENIQLQLSNIKKHIQGKDYVGFI